MEEFKAKKNFIWCSLIVYTEPANFQYTNILFFVYLYSEIHGSFPCRAICVLLFCLKDDIRDHIRYYYQRCRPLKLATWARICKCLWSPGIDSQESISPAYVAWRGQYDKYCRGFVPARQSENRYLVSLKDLQIRALAAVVTMLLRRMCTTHKFILFKLLRNTRIDSKEPIPPGCVAWRACTINLFLLDS